MTPQNIFRLVWSDHGGGVECLFFHPTPLPLTEFTALCTSLMDEATDRALAKEAVDSVPNSVPAWVGLLQIVGHIGDLLVEKHGFQVITLATVSVHGGAIIKVKDREDVVPPLSDTAFQKVSQHNELVHKRLLYGDKGPEDE